MKTEKNIKSEILIFIDSFSGIDYKHKAYVLPIIEKSKSVKEFLTLSEDYFNASIGQEKFQTVISAFNSDYSGFVLENLERKGITPITLFDNNYPKCLKEISIPPLVLYCKGNTKLLDGENFGIVGSRKSLPISVGLCKSYAEELSGAGFNLVTGIAEGIDKTVLETALKCGGKAITVIAGGFDNVYPKEHKNLMDEVIKTGLAVSEYPPEVISKPYMFPVRNRIIAGLSKGVLIVSGRLKSGTLYTAEYAEEYGRALFCIPYSPNIESGEGTNDLIKRGAMLTDKPQDILTFFNKEKKKEEIILSDVEKEVISVLKEGALHIEKIGKKLDKKTFELTPILQLLEIKGIISKQGTNVYGLSRNDLEA